MAHYSEAKGSGHRGKKLHHLEVAKGENGGYSVAHHYESSAQMHYQPPEVHNFGKGEGQAMLDHVGGAMGVESEAEAQDEAE